MNQDLEKLYLIAKKDTRLIIGLMSGTSLDGLDIALCEVSGNGPDTRISLLHFDTICYDSLYKTELRAVFSKRNVDLEKVCLLNEWIGITHAGMINNCLKKWGYESEKIDLVASHGQTIYHAPARFHKNDKFGNGTLQIGDGDHIAVKTGIICISDFRQKQIAAGGEGAPLAAYGDFLLFADKSNDRILLNIGGIANITFLPAGAKFNKVLCSDTGPGNTLMDAFIQTNFEGKHFDQDALLAVQGTINESLLKELKNDDFFNLPFPKTTGPELFNLNYFQAALQKSDCNSLSVYDILATLNKFTADTIAMAIKNLSFETASCELYVSGGGMHNPLLIQNLQEQLPSVIIKTTTEKNIDPDAKEAMLFALLANECIAGNAADFGEASAACPAIAMGKISFPG